MESLVPSKGRIGTDMNNVMVTAQAISAEKTVVSPRTSGEQHSNCRDKHTSLQQKQSSGTAHGNQILMGRSLVAH